MQAWKPVDYGNPLRDATMFYAPPSLERVVIGASPERGPESRSLDQDGPVSTAIAGPHQGVVIAAEPKKEHGNQGYSIYGNPDINYSKLYDLPVKVPKAKLPEDGRESSFLAYHDSAARSRSADGFEFLPKEIQTSLLIGQSGKFGAKEKGTGGGLRYIEPPNRKPDDYFYYTNDSPRYKLAPEAERKRLTKLLFQGERKQTTPVKFNVHNLDFGERKDEGKPYAFEKQYKPEVNQVVTVDDLVGRESLRSYAKFHKSPAQPPKRPLVRPQQPRELAEAVLYSFKNQHGQKQNVGVVYETPNHHSIPLTNYGQRPLSRRQPGAKRIYPLGSPFRNQAIKARPDYFPPQPRPPIYKTRPQRLEGVFGPALPQVAPQSARRTTYQQNPPPPPPPPPTKSPRFQPLQQDHEVYKTVRGMDYSRPKVILHVKDSGELFVPDPKAAISPNYDPRPRVEVVPGHGTLEDQLKRNVVTPPFSTEAPTTSTTTSSTTTTTTTKPQIPWRHDFSDMDGKDETKISPKRSAGIEPRQSQPIIFREPGEQQSSSGSFSFPGQEAKKRPFREVSSVQVPTVQVNVGSKRRRQTTAKPNYNVVIGLSYDDEDNRGSGNADFEVDFEDSIKSEEYSKGELYQLCIVEVPDYLREQLCSGLLNGNRRSDFLKVDPRNKARKPAVEGVVIPPRPANLLQGFDNSQQLSPEGNTIDYSPLTETFFGIPVELPVQSHSHGKQDTEHYANVKIYKPEAHPATTTTTTTTTTPRPQTQPQPQVHHVQRPQESNRRRRPLIFSKRNPNTGQSTVSRPFEYFSTLAQYLGNRLTGQAPPRRRSPPPRLVRKRIR